MIQNRIIYLIGIFIIIDCTSICHNTILDEYVNPITVSSSFSDIYIVDWKIVLLKMLQSVHFFDDIISENLVLVNIVKNNTSGILQTVKLTNILIELITENAKHYDVIDMDTMYRVYRELEISPNSTMNSYAFSIEVANYLNANYVIYSIVSGNSENVNLEMQLISTKTGEIIHVVHSCI